MAPPKKTKSGSSKKTTTEVAYTPLIKIAVPTLVGNQEFVPTPILRDEQLAIYASQVMIPFTLAKDTLGYMGHIINVTDLVKLKKFFPTYHVTKPIASNLKAAKKLAENSRV